MFDKQDQFIRTNCIMGVPKNAENKPPNIGPPSPGGLYLEIALIYKVKQSKNGKFPSNLKASPIDFETQNSLLT